MTEQCTNNHDSDAARHDANGYLIVDSKLLQQFKACGCEDCYEDYLYYTEPDNQAAYIRHLECGR